MLPLVPELIARKLQLGLMQEHVRSGEIVDKEFVIKIGKSRLTQMLLLSSKYFSYINSYSDSVPLTT